MLSLRRTLQLDAAASGGLGLLLAVLAPLANDHLGLPVGVSVGAGVFLVAWGAFVGWASTRDSAALAREIAWLNVAWVVLSVVVVVAGIFDLTGLGVAFVLAQAAAVVAFVALQWAAATGSARAESVRMS